MLKLVRLALAGLVIQASMTAAFAQQGGGGGRGFGGGFGGGLMPTSMLAQQESVQAELKLTDDQKTKLKEAGEKARAAFGGFGGGNNNRTEAEREEARKKAAEARQAGEKAVADILTPEQAKRVKEIALQQAGPMILASHEDTQKAVGITDDQKTKLKEVSDNLNSETRKLFQPGGGGGQDNRDKMRALRKDATDKVVALLTDEQKKTWEGLVGKKFEGEITFGGGRRPGTRPNNN